ncbi:hypothetical protein BLA29_008304 [Euroglyphus maynei]|uniref:Uncharacterized protein n=1 Tax=Euroglyphus maynei TaxID=6958 RepID=A0A1Y3B6V6_EURMA|nr:hypothetical protein BLA29_008304 [Euroglyphus maynei]
MEYFLKFMIKAGKLFHFKTSFVKHSYFVGKYFCHFITNDLKIIHLATYFFHPYHNEHFWVGLKKIHPKYQYDHDMDGCINTIIKTTITCDD